MRQSRGRRLTKDEVSIIKGLFSRHLNDTEMKELILKVIGKDISVKHINHIRNGYRWKDVVPTEITASP